MLGMRRGLPSSFILRDAEVAQDLRADAVGAQVDRLRAARRAPRLRASTCGSRVAASSPQLSSTATPRSLFCSAASARGSGQEWSDGPASSRSSTESGSCTRTSTSSAPVQRPRVSARCRPPVLSL